jgi:signal transduction histidine kinase
VWGTSLRTFHRRVFASLITRLTLAVLALLVLSLGLTTVVFAVQSYQSDRTTAISALRGLNPLLVRAKVSNALLNAHGRPPLALVRPDALGVDRVLITSWPDDVVAGDTLYSGGTASVASYGSLGAVINKKPSGVMSIGSVDYAYLVLPVAQGAFAAPYHDIVALERVRARSVGAVVSNLVKAGVVALLVCLVAAVVVLRAMTRPLQAMTRAAESMAAGDYDQQVVARGSSDEIGQLARSFNRMAYEVKHARELQRQFVANVSHDLRSPLTSVIGFSQALTEDETTTPWQRHTAAIINDEAQRMRRLTVDLLDLSRLEAGRLPLAMASLDLRALLGDIALRYQTLPSRHDVRVVVELGDDALPARGDPDRLTQVFVNLLDNAFKFADAEGEVRLRAARAGAVAVVEVYNTGAGIPSEDLPRVFDRFYRGDHSRARRTGGSGIGLAIVREIVHAHGGAVAASGEQGHWAALTVRLPLVMEAEDEFTEGLQPANTGTTRLPV